MSDSPKSDNEGKPRTLPSLYKRRRAAGEVELGERGQRLVEVMVFGLDRTDERLPGVVVGQPLSLEEAAEVLNLRRRNARQIFAAPAFRKLLTAAIADLRAGSHARMVHTMIKIADEPGDGTAADRTVRLKAAMAVLGEEAKGVSVNVQVNNQNNLAQTIRPGYVLDLSAMYGRRHDDDGPPTIECKREPRTPDAEPLTIEADPSATEGESE